MGSATPARGSDTPRAGGLQFHWRADAAVEPLEEGARGSGARRGEVGLGDFRAGTYPACSRHGAMNCVGVDPSLWRCLAEGCNAGAIWR